MDFDISEVDKSFLAMLSGFGFVGIGLFFYFFMLEKTYQPIYVTTIIVIIMSALTAFFYLLDDLNFMFNLALSRDDPDSFKTKVRRGARMVSGMLLMGLIGVNLIVYTGHGGSFEIRVLIITILTFCSVFLFLYSMLLAEE